MSNLNVAQLLSLDPPPPILLLLGHYTRRPNPSHHWVGTKEIPGGLALDIGK